MLNRQIKIGVIAGTPVDTQMGIDFVQKKGYEAKGIATGSSPQEQNILQFLKPETLIKKVIDIIHQFESEDIYRTLIYCNSLSAAIDLEYIKKACPKTKLVTPLDVYKKTAADYNNLIIWAANGKSLKTIEEIFYQQNPSINILGVSMLPVVKAIENLEPPELIVDKFNLAGFLLSDSEWQGLILGCTHFPYLSPVLEKRTNITIIDPAELMLQDLLA